MEEFLIQLNLEVMNDFNTHHHLICRMLCLNFKEVRLFQSIQCLIPGNVDVFSKIALKTGYWPNGISCRLRDTDLSLHLKPVD